MQITRELSSTTKPMSDWVIRLPGRQGAIIVCCESRQPGIDWVDGIDHKNKRGMTTLLLASQGGHLEAARILAEPRKDAPRCSARTAGRDATARQ